MPGLQRPRGGVLGRPSAMAAGESRGDATGALAVPRRPLLAKRGRRGGDVSEGKTARERAARVDKCLRLAFGITDPGTGMHDIVEEAITAAVEAERTKLIDSHGVPPALVCVHNWRADRNGLCVPCQGVVSDRIKSAVEAERAANCDAVCCAGKAPAVPAKGYVPPNRLPILMPTTNWVHPAADGLAPEYCQAAAIRARGEAEG